uniref:Uncharacterized protein n=1 Tax=Rhodococcus sp. NS1 TaxID=402236 RepID=A0A097SQN9_9NOCA|nr:hypothetical protein LRS1606.417 [Rhodococcus sp. NS1]
MRSKEPRVSGLSRGIAQILVARGDDVVDVPSTLAMKVRGLSTGRGRKTDPDDARAVALAALYHRVPVCLSSCAGGFICVLLVAAFFVG